MNAQKLSPLLLVMLSTQCLAATEELIVTGSYSPVKNEQLSSSVTIVNQPELMRLSSHSLVDALRQLPGIWVDQQGGPGGITSISLRGSESNHVLVQLDGVQLNDSTNSRGGAFDLNSVNMDSIKRIEIIRGAQSSIYGSDALAGVIHIITLEPGEQSTTLNATVGEDGYLTAGVSTAGKIADFGYAVSAQSKDGGEPVTGSTAKNNELLTKLNWNNETQSVDFTYRYFDGERTAFPEQSGGPELAANNNLDSSEYTDQSAAFGWQSQINGFWKSKIHTSWYQRNEDYTSPGIAPYDAVPASGSNTDFTRTGVSWINTLGDEKKLWGNLGVETRHEKGESQGYLDYGFPMPTDFYLSRRINSAFVNINGYLNEDWLVQASVRRDDAEDIAQKNSTQVGTRYQINPSLSWFANWGEGFKLPSFFALGHPLVGNPDLQPETATTQDTGFEWQQDNTTFNITYFKNRYRDLVDFDSETFTNVNRARVNTSGVDTEVTWQATPQLGLRLHGTYTDIDMLSSDNHLLGRPQVTAGSSVNFSLNEDWSINVNYLWSDERYAVSRYSGVDREETLSGFSRFDTSIHWQASKQAKLVLAIENITDDDYYNDIGFPNPGRAVKLRLNLSI